jgi:hypothetical protein
MLPSSNENLLYAEWGKKEIPALSLLTRRDFPNDEQKVQSGWALVGHALIPDTTYPEGRRTLRVVSNMPASSSQR